MYIRIQIYHIIKTAVCEYLILGITIIRLNVIYIWEKIGHCPFEWRAPSSCLSNLYVKQCHEMSILSWEAMRVLCYEGSLQCCVRMAWWQLNDLVFFNMSTYCVSAKYGLLVGVTFCQVLFLDPMWVMTFFYAFRVTVQRVDPSSAENKFIAFL